MKKYNNINIEIAYNQTNLQTNDNVLFPFVPLPTQKKYCSLTGYTK